jgi:hypothetical protein
MKSNIQRIEQESNGTVTVTSVAQLIQDACPYMSDSEAHIRAKIAIITLTPFSKDTAERDLIILLTTVLLVGPVSYIIASLIF